LHGRLGECARGERCGDGKGGETFQDGMHMVCVMVGVLCSLVNQNRT